MAGKDRKKELARQRFERQQQRREAELARARRTRVIGASVATAVVVLGGGGLAYALTKDDDTLAAPSGTCTYKDPASGEKASKDVGRPPVEPTDVGPVAAVLKTTAGDVTVELDGNKAPCTVNSFTYLASKGYFDKTECHRLTDKVLQCGDPSASGSGGPGYEFADENTEGAKYPAGTLAMANSGPGTNGSQFFIVYDNWDDLPPQYSVFGKVTGGLDKVKAVGKAGSEPAGDGKPKKKVEINSISIAKK